MQVTCISDVKYNCVEHFNFAQHAASHPQIPYLCLLRGQERY